VTGLILIVVGRKQGPRESALGQDEVNGIAPGSTESVSVAGAENFQPAEPPPPPSAVRRQTQIGAYFGRPSAGRPCAILEGSSAGVQGRTFAVEKSEVRIGAKPGNDLLIPEDDYLSGQHACLRYEQGALMIEDLGSRNGTFVNDKRVSGTSGRLAPGDRIVVGSSMFVLRQV